MRNPSLSNLRDAVREEITNAFEQLGFAKRRHVAHPGAIADIGRKEVA